MTADAITEVGYAGALATIPGDPYLTYGVEPAEILAMRRRGRALAWAFDGEFGPSRRGIRLTGLGAPDDVIALMDTLVNDFPEAIGQTVPRPCAPAVAAHHPGKAWNHWDWWFTRQAPPAGAPARDGHPGTAGITRQELALDDPRINPFLDIASPHSFARPGNTEIRVWFGLTHGDDLVATCAVTEVRPEVPHLAAVATHPEWRGRGLAGSLCGSVTADELGRGAPAVTLGMMATNDSARKVYDRLGFRATHQWSSRALSRQRVTPGTSDAAGGHVHPTASGGGGN